MADSPSYITRMFTFVQGEPTYQGAIDVYVHVSCPDFDIATGWYYAQCPDDIHLLEWLARNLPGHLSWERRNPPE